LNIDGVEVVQDCDYDGDGIPEYLLLAPDSGVYLLNRDGTPYAGGENGLLVAGRFRAVPALLLQETTPSMLALFAREPNQVQFYHLPVTPVMHWRGWGNNGGSWSYPLRGEHNYPEPELNVELIRDGSEVTLYFGTNLNCHILNGFAIYQSPEPYSFPDDPITVVSPCSNSWSEHLTSEEYFTPRYYQVKLLYDDPYGANCFSRSDH